MKPIIITQEQSDNYAQAIGYFDSLPDKYIRMGRGSVSAEYEEAFASVCVGCHLSICFGIKIDAPSWSKASEWYSFEGWGDGRLEELFGVTGDVLVECGARDGDDEVEPLFLTERLWAFPVADVFRNARARCEVAS